MKIKNLNLNSLIEYENNPRDNDAAVDAVAASISEFGFKVPIVVDSNLVIVAGHTRLKAAKKLGLTEVPCLIADDLTDEQIKAFRLADNKTAELATWDLSKLEEELFDIDMDMLQFGFEELHSDIPDNATDDDFDPDSEIPEVPVSQKGDLYVLGNHRVLCGDSTIKEDVGVLVNEKLVDKFLKNYFNNNIDEYYNDLLSKLEKTNYKLYRYIPINYYRKDVKANLMHKNQYGFHSIMNQYVYHNKPSFFNDPFDSFFGIGVDSFLSVMLSQFAEIKDFRTLKEILDESGDTKDIKQVYEIIDKLKIAPEIKEYVKFIFEKIIEVLFSNPDKNIDELYVDFTKAIMNDPLKFLAFLKPFYLDNLDEEKTKEQMLLISENIGAGKLKGMLNEQFNPSTEKFVDVANMMGMKDDAHKFEKALNDGVKNFNNRIFEFNDNQFGVASLTTSFNNPLMWSHYANSHKGICIEYDLSEDIKDIASLKTLLIPVKYSNERVTVDYTLMDKIDLNNIEAKGKNDILKFFISGLYTKHDVWKYEDEWRSIIPVKQGNRNIQLGKISALYLGNKMEEATTNMIINLINKSNNGLDEISIFKMVNDISDYKLNPVQIK